MDDEVINFVDIFPIRSLGLIAGDNHQALLVVSKITVGQVLELIEEKGYRSFIKNEELAGKLSNLLKKDILCWYGGTYTFVPNKKPIEVILVRAKGLKEEGTTFDFHEIIIT